MRPKFLCDPRVYSLSYLSSLQICELRAVAQSHYVGESSHGVWTSLSEQLKANIVGSFPRKQVPREDMVIISGKIRGFEKWPSPRGCQTRSTKIVKSEVLHRADGSELSLVPQDRGVSSSRMHAAT